MALNEAYISQASEYIRSAFETYIPGIVITPGSALEDIVINGSKYLLAMVLQEVDRIKQSWNISNYGELSSSDMDRLGENLLVSRDQGDKGYGLVNFYYKEPQSVYIFSGLIVTSESTTTQVETLSSLSYEPRDFLYVDGEYYIQVPVATIDYGTAEIDAGVLTTILNRTGQWLRVNNTSPITAGLPVETNSSYYGSIKTGISNRTLETQNGQQALISELFPGIVADSLSIGNGDDEMERDTLYLDGDNYNLDKLGTSTGIHIGTKVDTYIRFDNLSYVKKVISGKREELFNRGFSISTTVNWIETKVTFLVDPLKQSGWLWLEPGTSSEEKVRYIEVLQTELPDGTMIRNYRLSDDNNVLYSHSTGGLVISINNVTITIKSDGDITLVPVLYISSIQQLDPVTLAPSGIYVEPSSANEPGWSIIDIDSYDHMSSKEDKLLVIADKREQVNLSSLTADDCKVSLVGTETILSAATGTDFTGRQGQTILVYTTNGEEERTILRVISTIGIVVSGDAIVDPTVDVFIESLRGEASAYPLEITYYSHSELSTAQSYMDNSEGRNLCADYLARAFFPQFIDLDITFKGTADLSDIRTALSSFMSGSVYQQNEFYDSTTRTMSITYDQIVSSVINSPGVEYIESPIEIKIEQVNPNGSKTYKWINPSSKNKKELAVKNAISPNDKYIALRIPDESEFFPNSNGRIRLGGYTDDIEYIEYSSYIIDGDSTSAWYVFIISDTSTISYTHLEDQAATVMHENLLEDNIIADNIITSDRIYRPYLRTIILNKVEV